MDNTIKISFLVDWPHWDDKNNEIFKLLQKKYNVEISTNPDILFFSIFDHFKRLLKYQSCVKVQINGEPFALKPEVYDFALSYDDLNKDNIYRLPVYWYDEKYQMIYDKNIDSNDYDKYLNRKFCNFIYSNRCPPYRNEFFEKLSKYKQVDSFGRWLNNTGINFSCWEQKIELQKSYKFTIAMENNSVPGYTTEKIVHAMRADSLPIYWGNPNISEDFNTCSFLNCNNLSVDDAVERVIELDKDPDKYLNMLKQPWVIKRNDNLLDDNILKFMDKIIDKSRSRETLTKYQDKEISIHDLPSRKFFESELLPLVKDKTPVLDIGIRKYTLDYPKLLNIDDEDYYTADIQLSDGVDKVDFLSDVSSHNFIHRVNVTFGSIIFMGVMGVGINYHPQIKMAFMNFNQILKDDGLLIMGWPEYPKLFLKNEIGLQHYNCDDLTPSSIIPLLKECGFSIIKIHDQEAYRGDDQWKDEKKYQIYMLAKKENHIEKAKFISYVRQFDMIRQTKDFERPLK